MKYCLLACIALGGILALSGCPKTDEGTIMLPGDVRLEMVWVPGGSFMMGRNAGEVDSHATREDPRHEVTFAQGFWMGKFELTKAQWTAVMGTSPWEGRDNILSDGDSPAVYVSWNDAQAFIDALNAYTGLAFRLPSESEWEYACRAGMTTRFSWGDDPDHSAGEDYCWWSYNSNVDNGCAHVCGQKEPNNFGLHDMSGNVMEWCEDDWHYTYDDAPADGSAWIEEPRTGFCLLRGGGCTDIAKYCRSASRAYNQPANGGFNIGFRVVR